MTTERHQAISALLDEYALGQLPPESRRDVEDHVRGCAECAAELHELMLVMDGLARAPEPVPLPAGLKGRVLAGLARETQVSSSRIPATTSTWSRGVWLAAAAAVVAVLGTALYLSIERSRRATEDLRAARAETADRQARLEDYAEQTDLALSILTSRDMQRLELSGSEAWRSAAARAYWSPTRGLLLVADHLPTPPAGRIYQVWVIGASKPVSAGLLGSPASGRGMLIAPPPESISSGSVTVAVTDEPPGGLPAPSGSIRLAGSI